MYCKRGTESKTKIENLSEPDQFFLIYRSSRFFRLRRPRPGRDGRRGTSGLGREGRGQPARRRDTQTWGVSSGRVPFSRWRSMPWTGRPVGSDRSRVHGRRSDPSGRGWRRCRRSAAIAAGRAAGWSILPGQRRAADEPDGAGLIVRSRRPLDLETPVSALDRSLTPNDLFFVRSHFGAPAVGPAPWRSRSSGLVERPLTSEPRRPRRVRAGDGHGRPPVLGQRPGELPAEDPRRGLGPGRGRATPSGPASGSPTSSNGPGSKAGAAHVHFLGADGPPSPKTPLFLRSIPLEKALHPDTLLATAMNGAPLARAFTAARSAWSSPAGPATTG